MSDEERVRLRPRHLAVVWGTAFGQVVDLWRTWLTNLMEVGSGEDKTIPTDECNRITVPSVGGVMPKLTTRNLVGVSFGNQLDGRVVTFTEQGPAGPGLVLVDCCIDESSAQDIQGDVYEGEVVDEQDAVVARIELDAGN
jgi:hypothetical protein